MAATFNDGLVKGRDASSAISLGRAVILDTTDTTGMTVKQGSSPTAAPLFGVSKFSVTLAEIAQGKGCSVVMDGIAIVEAGSALAVGVRVTIDSSGRAVAASAGNYLLGTVVESPASAAGDFVSVQLECNGVKA